MKIGILGTGHVARLLASAWANAGHAITLGSRDPGAKRLDFPVNTLAETVRWADVVVNATPGAATLATLSTVDPGRFAGKTLIDVANALTPAFALVYPNSSRAEHLQAALPGAHVVKTLNTGAMTLMADPRRIGPSTVFLSGDDAGAKREARGLLRDLPRAQGGARRQQRDRSHADQCLGGRRVRPGVRSHRMGAAPDVPHQDRPP